MCAGTRHQGPADATAARHRHGSGAEGTHAWRCIQRDERFCVWAPDLWSPACVVAQAFKPTPQELACGTLQDAVVCRLATKEVAS